MMRRITADSLEGTWEEIAEQAPQLSGKRVRLTILADESNPAESPRIGAPATDGTLAEALAGLTGVAHSLAYSGGKELRLSEDETSFAEYLEQKRREGRL